MLGLDLQKLVRQHRFSEDFTDLGLIGSGGYAEVHHVRQNIDGRHYALKVIRVKSTKNGEETQERLYRALNQARLHSQLHHSSILHYHGCWIQLLPFGQEEQEAPKEEEQEEFEMVVADDSIDSDGFCFGSVASEQESLPADKTWQTPAIATRDPKCLTGYKEIQVFVMTELCELDLQHYLYRRNQKGCIGSEYWHENCRMGLDMVAGLRHMHAKKMLHRDIKLQNVVLQEGRCKLIDFGIARKAKTCQSLIQHPSSVAAEEEWLSKSVGTPLFSSPEQATSAQYDHRTDIFSLAIVILLLFSSFTTVHQQRDLIDSIRLRKLDSISVPAPLKDVLHRCLGEQALRPSLSELQTALKQTMRKEPPQVQAKLPLAELSRNTAPLLHHKFVDLSAG